MFYNFINGEKEKPLDRQAVNGGLVRIFKNIGVIGDSLASGEFELRNAEGQNIYADMFEYSWGKHIEHATGSTVQIFARGGMTAKEYVEGFAEKKGYWDKAKICDAFIIALGYNDLFGLRQKVGKTDIAEENTFAKYYLMLIDKLREINPDAKIFLMTMCKEEDKAEFDGLKKEHKELLSKICAKYGCYLIDLYTYAPEYTNEFKEQFYLYGHMNAMGYIFTAEIVMSYIDYIIRHNMSDFKEVGTYFADMKTYVE